VQIAAKPDLANIGGGIVTLYQEAAKSGLVNEDYMSYSEVFGAFFTSLGNANEWKEWKEIAEKDKFTAKGLKLSLLAMTLNQLADEGLARVTMFDQQTKEVFDHPEYQLHLSSYRIEATPMGGDYTVEVTTQSYWYLDQYSGADWLHVAKDEAHSQILIHVDEHASEQSRYGYVTVHTNSEEIAPSVTLTVMQEGIAFSLSETSMTFTGDKDYKILYVYTNSQVKEWKVKDHPRWLECKKEGNTVFCETSSGFAGSFGEMSEGNIVIEATFNDGTKKTKNCAVQWLPDQSAVWDNTRWNFSGTVTVSYQGQTASTPASFTLIVNNVASNDVYIVVNGTNYACKASEDSAKRLHCSFSNGVGTANFTFTRSGSTASCDYTGPLISGAVESGHFDGTLQ